MMPELSYQVMPQLSGSVANISKCFVSEIDTFYLCLDLKCYKMSTTKTAENIFSRYTQERIQRELKPPYFILCGFQ